MKKESFNILLKEYDNLFQNWKRVRETGSDRMRLLLNVTVFAFSGMGLILKFGNDDLRTTSLLFVATFSLLSIIATQTLIFMVNRSICLPIWLRL